MLVILSSKLDLAEFPSFWWGLSSEDAPSGARSIAQGAATLFAVGIAGAIAVASSTSTITIAPSILGVAVAVAVAIAIAVGIFVGVGLQPSSPIAGIMIEVVCLVAVATSLRVGDEVEFDGALVLPMFVAALADRFPDKIRIALAKLAGTQMPTNCQPHNTFPNI
jgi:hypothetical protein